MYVCVKLYVCVVTVHACMSTARRVSTPERCLETEITREARPLKADNTIRKHVSNARMHAALPPALSVPNPLSSFSIYVSHLATYLRVLGE